MRLEWSGDSGKDLGRGRRVAGCRYVPELVQKRQHALVVCVVRCEVCTHVALFLGRFLDDFIEYFWTLLYSELSFWPSQTLSC